MLIQSLSHTSYEDNKKYQHFFCLKNWNFTKKNSSIYRVNNAIMLIQNLTPTTYEENKKPSFHMLCFSKAQYLSFQTTINISWTKSRKWVMLTGKIETLWTNKRYACICTEWVGLIHKWTIKTQHNREC